jgi:hypothetical protein
VRSARGQNHRQNRDGQKHADGNAIEDTAPFAPRQPCQQIARHPQNEGGVQDDQMNVEALAEGNRPVEDRRKFTGAWPKIIEKTNPRKNECSTAS